MQWRCCFRDGSHYEFWMDYVLWLLVLFISVDRSHCILCYQEKQYCFCDKDCKWDEPSNPLAFNDKQSVYGLIGDNKCPPAKPYSRPKSKPTSCPAPNDLCGFFTHYQVNTVLNKSITRTLDLRCYDSTNPGINTAGSSWTQNKVEGGLIIGEGLYCEDAYYGSWVESFLKEKNVTENKMTCLCKKDGCNAEIPRKVTATSSANGPVLDTSALSGALVSLTLIEQEAVTTTGRAKTSTTTDGEGVTLDCRSAMAPDAICMDTDGKTRQKSGQTDTKSFVCLYMILPLQLNLWMPFLGFFKR